MAGTRGDVLTNIEAWVNDLSMPNILWLSGSPGSGKTTIASTVVACFEHFSGQFFFHRDQAELRNPDNLWRCLALDLAQGNIALKMRIAQELEGQKANIRGLDIPMQFEHLIVKPLQEVSQSLVKPLLLVVDALDECDSYGKLLPSLQSCSQLSKSLKLLVTSRHYPDIQDALNSVSCHIHLHTGDEVSDQTSHDLELYFTKRFSDMTRLQRSSLHLSWPGQAEISFLVRNAAGLYIWAKSAMDFILHRGGDTEERLKVILSDSGEGIDAIDTLYQHIVFVAFQGLREVERDSLSSVLGAIVIAKNPLRANDLEQLLGVRDALSIMSQLSPVLLVRDTGHLHICHQSFTDFLLDQKRSKAFWVDSQKHSLCLAGSCMKFMSAKLKFNFFDLKTSHIQNEDIPNLVGHIQDVKSTALYHASYFWATYLQGYSDKTLEEEIMVQMEQFLMNHLLHWLEIMSILGAVNQAAHLLLLAENWCRVSVS
jgi:DNA polymerase III delta prime subunit